MALGGHCQVDPLHADRAWSIVATPAGDVVDQRYSRADWKPPLRRPQSGTQPPLRSPTRRGKSIGLDSFTSSLGGTRFTLTAQEYAKPLNEIRVEKFVFV